MRSSVRQRTDVTSPDSRHGSRRTPHRGRCCRGCAPATSPSSTTSTWIEPPPRRSSTPGWRPWSTPSPIDLRPLPEPRPRAAGRGGRRCSSTPSAPARSARSRTAPGPARTRAPSTRRRDRAVASGRCSTATPSRPRWPRPAPAWRRQLATLHPQQHRVPPPRAGPPAARARRTPARRPRSPVARWSWCAGTTSPPSCRRIRPFLREQNPVLIGVERGADAAPRRRAAPDVVVIDARRARRPAECRDPEGSQGRRGPPRPPAAARRRHRPARAAGLRPLRFESTATPEDAALLLADAAEPP